MKAGPAQLQDLGTAGARRHARTERALHRGFELERRTPDAVKREFLKSQQLSGRDDGVKVSATGNDRRKLAVIDEDRTGAHANRRKRYTLLAQTADIVSNFRRRRTRFSSC